MKKYETMGRKKQKVLKRILAAGVAGSMILGVGAGIGGTTVQAEQTMGNAPFINSWLVSGPFEEPVADVIYGSDGTQIQRPEDGNWARVADVSASSIWQGGQISYPDNSNPASGFMPEKAVDGDMGTAWVSQTHNSETGGPEDWPDWDPNPTFYLDWKQPVEVHRIETFGRGGDVDFNCMTVVLKGKDGEVLRETELVESGTDTTGTAVFEGGVSGVYRVEIGIVYEGKPASIAGVGFTEINVYDTEGGEEPEVPERPADGNWASLASASANSEHMAGGYEAGKAVDGNLSTSWSCNGGAAPLDTYTLTLGWDYTVDVQKIEVYDRNADGGWGDTTAVTCRLYDAEGTLLETAETTSPHVDEAGYVEFENKVTGVAKIEMDLQHERADGEDYGLAEVYVFDGEGIVDPEPEVPERPEDGNWAPLAAAEASSIFSPAYPASNAIDGNLSTDWAALGSDGQWPRTLTLTWDYPVSVKRIEAFSRAADNGVDSVTSVQCVLFDGEDNKLGEAVMTDPGASSTGYAEFENEVAGVRRLVMTLDGAKTGNIGFKEVYVFDGAEEELPEPPEPLGDISPVKGELFGTEGGTQKEWEYFDDRIWNRNYDDYQDLYGYYAVRKGVDTRNKYVFAHTYVYSPKARRVQLRVGASGSYRLFVNDVPVNSFTKPATVHKDMTVENVVLKEGWNKVLIEIHHTFTDDLNANGVPIAKDADVSYLGFYARITDRMGNAVDGLICSVGGDSTEELQIVDRKLGSKEINLDAEGLVQGAGMGLPENNMPAGYKEWPYVWNKSTTGNTYGVSSSAFQFEASGGVPGYTWEIIDGELPKGLELTKDGKIADGLVNNTPDLNSDKGIISIDCPEGDYTFTVQVTDKDGNKAQKEFTIQVKERPNKWFEEGGVSALSHHIVIPNWYVDPNFSADSWAQRAKAEGHTLVSIESLQQHYYWPSRFADMTDERHQYFPVDENGQMPDLLKSFEEAVKRYGMQFGLYYATAGYNWSLSEDVFVQDLADLINRYDPVYIYLDGPQGWTYGNYDVMYSSIRNYSDDIIINSNAWGEEYGDVDLGTSEASPHYSNVQPNHFVKKVVFEPWKGATFPGAEGGYYPHKRNDYRLIVKEMITNIGRGYSDNFEQGPGTGRGPVFDSTEVIADTYPSALQRNMDVRDELSAWFAPEGKPDRHEATTGTTPYYLAGYGYEDDGKGNYDNFAFPSGKGPQWGYAVSRDNNIYLHIMKGGDGKQGFDAIEDDTLVLSPFKDNVEQVVWLNEGREIAKDQWSQDGETLTIDLSGVEEDPADTIIKIVTDSEARKYKLTSLYLEGEQLSEDSLQIKVEGQMTFPQLKADLESLTFTSSDPEVASVDSNGIVTPGENGTAAIMVKGSYEGTEAENSIKVRSKDGKVYIGEDMTGAVLTVNGWEAYGELYSSQQGGVKVEGRAVTGGSISLDTADITWHAGTVDIDAGDKWVPIVIEENDIFSVDNGILTQKPVETKTRAVVWADVELDGKTVTTNRVFMDLLPYENLAKTADVTVSENEEAAVNLTDEEKITAEDVDQSKWTAENTEDSWVQFDFGTEQTIDRVDVTFNSKEQYYINTPVKYDIQISNNGEDWETLSSNNGPNGEAWMNVAASHTLNQTARYLRLHFYGGANSGSVTDILEIAAYGVAADQDYKIFIDAMDNGCVAADKTEAEAGETVTLTVIPNQDYQLKDASLKVNDGTVPLIANEDGTYSFIMPETDVTVTAEFEQIPEVPEEPGAVRELLQKTYDRVRDLSTEGVVDSAAKAFEEALASAKDILENRPDAADEEMLEAWNRLVDATHGLGLVKGDKTVLEVLVSQAEEMMTNADRYVEENWPQLEEALAEAKAVLEDNDAMDDTIRPAEEKLLDAILAQRYKADKDNLQALIDKANAIDLSQYTEESVSVFKAALKTASAVLADENLSQDDQAVVDSAVKELDAAVSGLVKTSDGGNTGDGNTSDSGDGGSTGDNSDNGDGNTGSSNSGTKDGGSRSDTPKTGDSTDVVLWGAVMTAALAVFATGRRRRKL